MEYWSFGDLSSFHHSQHIILSSFTSSTLLQYFKLHTIKGYDLIIHDKVLIYKRFREHVEEGIRGMMLLIAYDISCGSRNLVNTF